MSAVLEQASSEIGNSPAPAVVAMKEKNVIFVLPTLIAEIEYRAWTNDGNLRHASYKGLREVQDNAAVYKIST